MNDTSVETTAGLFGFLVLFGLGVAVILLGIDLTRRLRRMRYREADRQRLLEEQRQAGRQGTGDAGPQGDGDAEAPGTGDDPAPLG